MATTKAWAPSSSLLPSKSSERSSLALSKRRKCGRLRQTHRRIMAPATLPRDRVKRVLPSRMLPAEPLPATSLLPAEPLKTVPLAQAEPPPPRPQLQAESLLATPQATRYPRSVRSATIPEARTIIRKLPRTRQTPAKPLQTTMSRPLSSLSPDSTICTGSSLLVWYEHAPRVRMFSWAGCKLKGKA